MMIAQRSSSPPKKSRKISIFREIATSYDKFPETERKHFSSYCQRNVKCTPKSYIRLRMRSLYKNIFLVSLADWALLAFRDVFITIWPDPKLDSYRFLLDKTCGAAIYVFVVPSIMRHLSLHYSIIVPMMGMGTLSTLFVIPNHIFLTIVAVLTTACKTVYTASANIYLLKLARCATRLQGTALWFMYTLMYGIFKTFIHLTQLSTGTFFYAQWNGDESGRGSKCGPAFCNITKMYMANEVFPMMYYHQQKNGILIFLLMALSIGGVFATTIKLNSANNLMDEDLSAEPVHSNTFDVLRQFRRPKVPYLVLLYINSTFFIVLKRDFFVAYTRCLLSTMDETYTLLFEVMPLICGAMSTPILIELFGVNWLYFILINMLVITATVLLKWDRIVSSSELPYYIVANIMGFCTSVVTVLRTLIAVQTLGDQEVSCWCFLGFIEDTTWIIALMLYERFCMEIELWINIALGPVTILVLILIDYKSNPPVDIYEACVQQVQIDSTTVSTAKTFNLNDVIKRPDDIRKVTTLLQHEYIVISRDELRNAEDKTDDENPQNEYKSMSRIMMDGSH